MRIAAAVAVWLALIAAPAEGATVFDSGNADGRMAMGSRPASSGKIEIDAADDFVLDSPVPITGVKFTGLFVGTTTAATERVDVDVFRIFPDGSANPPSGQVPTRANSPSDNAFASRSSADGGVSFGVSVLAGSFSTLNSVLTGIHPKPNQTTGGDGPVTGEEARVAATFTDPIQLPADHYFLVPRIEVSSGEFYWLSAAKPITAPGTPFSADQQAWIRDAALAPDWLRVGTDIVGGGSPPTFNASFSLDSDCRSMSIAAPPAGTAGSEYSTALVASGGAAPYRFGTVGGLPPGLSVSTDGRVTGTPTTPGTFAVTVPLTDSRGCSGSAGIAFQVGDAQTQTQTGTAAVPPRCTLAIRSRRVRLRGRRRTRGRVKVVARCDQNVSGRLSGSVSIRRRKHRSHASVRKLRRALKANVARTVSLKLPRRSLRALKRRARERLSLTLTATGASGGVSVTKAKPARLAARRR